MIGRNFYKRIEEYKDLKDSEVGDKILINGRVELRISSKEGLVKRFNYKENIIYTISLDSPFFVLNHYGRYADNNLENLVPFMKTCCKIGSETALEDELRKKFENVN